MAEGNEGWQVIDLNELADAEGSDAVSYREFLNVDSMHCGIYRLAAGSKDMQTPHDEDEMYYVLSGRARLKLDDEVREVKPGTLMYVAATQEHSFFEIEEDMVLLVIFASHPPI